MSSNRRHSDNLLLLRIKFKDALLTLLAVCTSLIPFWGTIAVVNAHDDWSDGFKYLVVLIPGVIIMGLLFLWLRIRDGGFKQRRLLNQISQSLASGDYEPMIKQVDEALEMDAPIKVRCAGMLFYGAMGRVDEALIVAEGLLHLLLNGNLVRVDKNDTFIKGVTLAFVAEYQFWSGRQTDAEASIARALLLAEDDSNVLRVAAFLALHGNRLEDAERFLDTLARSNQLQAGVWYTRYQLLRLWSYCLHGDTADMDRRLALIEKDLGVPAVNEAVMFFLILGYIQSFRGKPLDAAEAFDRAAKIDPNGLLGSVGNREALLYKAHMDVESVVISPIPDSVVEGRVIHVTNKMTNRESLFPVVFAISLGGFFLFLISIVKKEVLGRGIGLPPFDLIIILGVLFFGFAVPSGTYLWWMDFLRKAGVKQLFIDHKSKMLAGLAPLVSVQLIVPTYGVFLRRYALAMVAVMPMWSVFVSLLGADVMGDGAVIEVPFILSGLYVSWWFVLMGIDILNFRLRPASRRLILTIRLVPLDNFSSLAVTVFGFFLILFTTGMLLRTLRIPTDPEVVAWMLVGTLLFYMLLVTILQKLFGKRLSTAWDRRRAMAIANLGDSGIGDFQEMIYEQNEMAAVVVPATVEPVETPGIRKGLIIAIFVALGIGMFICLLSVIVAH